MSLLRLFIFALVLLPVTAHAQLQAPNRRDVVENVAARCPGLVLADHAFTDAVATVLWQQDDRWGRNGKRGNANDPSHDAIAYRNPASPFGVSVVDIIGAAGSPSASPAWIDQTQATLDARTTGVWVRPSGVLPPCLTGQEPAPPPDNGGSNGGSSTQPAPSIDLAPLLAALARIEASLSALESRPSADLSPVIAELHALIAAQNAEHLDDIKQRIDAVRADTERTRAVVERARVLRY